MTIKLSFALVCFITMFVMMICVYFINKQQGKIKSVLKGAVYAAFVAVAASAMEMIIDNYISMVVFRTLFYSSMDFICYMILQYTYEYTGQERLISSKKIFTVGEKLIILVDCLALFIGIFIPLEGQFVIETFGKERFLTFIPALPYYVHLVICYMFLANAFVRLIVEAARSAVLYRIKYLCVIISFALVVVLDGIYLSKGFVIDISILFFALCVIFITYFTFYFVPKELRNKIQGIVLSHMKDYVFIFDEEGKFIYLNKDIDSMAINGKFFVDASKNLNVFKKMLNDGCISDDRVCVEIDGENRYFRQASTKLEDQKGRYIGVFYVLSDITEEEKLEKEKFILKNFDTLTGVYNREYFIEKATDFIKEKPDEKYLLICTDIRHFKTLNDIFGARVGDQVLQSIAREIKYDDNKNRVYGRVGGDSFAICVKKNEFVVEEFVEKLRSTLQIPYLQYNIVNNIGIYEIEDVDFSVASMCDRAMMAISNSKNELDSEIAYYDEKLRNILLQEQSILKDVDKAFNQRQFVIYLQPQINHREHKIQSAEALVRWNHPDKGLILPGDFIPIMEKHGLITRLDRYVWDMACAQLSKWRVMEIKDMAISVNISPKDFNSLDLFEEFTALTKKYNIDSSSIRLEITETAYATDVAKQMATIEKLRDAGFIVQMDDFGNKYSSLNTLKDMPVDVLKLDMAFLSNQDKYNRSSDILRMIVAMADVLGIPVIAEGVETKEQADYLGSIGCDVVQGFYYAKPMPISQYENLVKEFNGQKYDEYKNWM